MSVRLAIANETFRPFQCFFPYLQPRYWFRVRFIQLFWSPFQLSHRIYATPSNILHSSGSVGVFFIMWLLGAFIATCGTVVYVEFGTGLPRSGGEKNYLEFVYRRPKFLISCGFAGYIVIMVMITLVPCNFPQVLIEHVNGKQRRVQWMFVIIVCPYWTSWSTLSPDLLHSLSVTPSYFYTRLVAFFCITFIFLIHGTLLPWGVRLQNTLAAFKFIALAAISLTGILCLTGVGGLKVRDGYEKPDNFRWEHFWEGSQGKGANAFFNGLYSVIWWVTSHSQYP